MGLPTFFVRNYFSDVQFDHVITADEDQANAFRVADGRRSALSFWRPPSLAAEHTIAFDAKVGNTVSWDICALDRGHNLAGKTVHEERSTNGTGWTNVGTYVIPTTAATNGDIDAANGVTTKEGAWIKRHASATDRFGRLRIPSMGAGLTPTIVGLWMSPEYAPGANIRMPTADERYQLNQVQETNEHGWRGGGEASQQRKGEFLIKFQSLADFDTAAVDLRDEYGLARLLWVVFDDERTERAFVSQLPDGSIIDFPYRADWGHRQAHIPFEEYQPKRPNA